MPKGNATTSVRLAEGMDKVGDDAAVLPASRALALAAIKFVTKIKTNSPLIKMPTRAGPRILLKPCLAIPNRETTPETKPTSINKSATSSTMTLAPERPPRTIKPMTMNAQTQLAFAAWCENALVCSVAGTGGGDNSFMPMIIDRGNGRLNSTKSIVGRWFHPRTAQTGLSMRSKNRISDDCRSFDGA